MKKLNNIKKISTLLCLLITVLISSCNNNDGIIFSGDEKVMFTDSLAYMPVTPGEQRIFEIEVALSEKAHEDRSFAVELDILNSNVTEGVHFDLLTNNVVVKAGELVGKVMLKGHYDQLSTTKQHYLTLKLLAPKNQIWELYGHTVKVNLIKCIPFDIKKYVGNLRLYAKFPFSDSSVKFLCKSEVVNDSILLIKGAFSDKYDLKVRFLKNEINPFENRIIVTEQPVFIDVNYGLVHANTVEVVPSVYDIDKRMFGLNLDIFVPKLGTFGIHPYLFEWVSQAEADAENNSTGTPMFLKTESKINIFDK